MVGKNVLRIFAEDYPKDYPEPESVVAILRRGMKVEEIPVVMREREGGVSSISMKKSSFLSIACFDFPDGNRTPCDYQ
jgi:hypothetical protein